MEFLDLYERKVLWDDLDNDSKKKIFLSDETETKGVKVCRFCARTEKETLFDNSSHAVSEMIGNRWLFSHYECRECNKAFGNKCEDSFGKYLLPLKIVSRQFGKKDKMGYSEVTGNITISKKDPLLHFDEKDIKMLAKQTNQGNMITLTEDGFDLSLERKKYVPEWVYFSLIKIGISVLPFELLNRYAYLRASLKVALDNENERENIFEKIDPFGILEVISGTYFFEKVNLELFVRKDENLKEYPYCFLCLNFGYYSIQLPLPEDKQRNGDKIKAIPYIHFKDSTISRIDFHKFEKEFKCSFHADKKEYSDEERMKLQKLLLELQECQV